jgi:hypothetical protein
VRFSACSHRTRRAHGAAGSLYFCRPRGLAFFVSVCHAPCERLKVGARPERSVDDLWVWQAPGLRQPRTSPPALPPLSDIAHARCAA